MVKKDDIIKAFQDVMHGVTTNGDECIVLYLDKSRTELCHFGTSRGQQFLSKHEDISHRFLAFCNEVFILTVVIDGVATKIQIGADVMKTCLNTTDTASNASNIPGNGPHHLGDGTNFESRPGPTIMEKVQSTAQNGPNNSNYSESGTNPVKLEHNPIQMGAGISKSVSSGVQTGLNPVGNQSILVKREPDPVHSDQDSAQNNRNLVQIGHNPVQIAAGTVQNVSSDVQTGLNPVGNQSILVKREPDPVHSDQDSAQNNRNLVQIGHNPVQIAAGRVQSVSSDVQTGLNPVGNQSMAVKREADPVDNDQDSAQNKRNLVQIGLSNNMHIGNDATVENLARNSAAEPSLTPKFALFSSNIGKVTSKPAIVPNITVLNSKPNSVNYVLGNKYSATGPNLTLNPEAAPNFTPSLATAPNLTQNSAVVPNLTPISSVVPNFTPSSAIIPNLTPNSAVVPNLISGPEAVPNLATNSAAVPNFTTNLATVPNFVTNSATVPNFTTNSAAVPNLTTNSATVPNLTTNSATVPNLTTNSATVTNLTTNSATVPNFTINSATEPNLTLNSAVVPNSMPISRTVQNSVPNSAVVPNLSVFSNNDHSTESGAPERGRLSKVDNQIIIMNYSHSFNIKDGVKKSPASSTKLPVVLGKRRQKARKSKRTKKNCSNNKASNKSWECWTGHGMKKIFPKIKPFPEVFPEITEDLSGAEDMELECIEVKKESEESSDQCEEHLHVEQGLEHMEQFGEHMSDSGEHIGTYDKAKHLDSVASNSEQGENHKGKSKAAGNIYIMDVQEHSREQLNIPGKQMTESVNESGEHIALSEERLDAPDCIMSLQIVVNGDSEEIVETLDIRDDSNDQEHRKNIGNRAGKRKKTNHISTAKKVYQEEKVESILDVSYFANCEMAGGASLKCLECNQKFECLENLQTHLLTAKHEQVSTTETAFKCFTCFKYYQREWDLQQHMINTRHNGNSSLKLLADFRSKLRVYSTKDGTKIYRCLCCRNKCRNLEMAKEHIIKGQCIRKKMLPCKCCKKVFSDRNSYFAHLKSVHKDEYPFRCTNCFRTFYRKPNLNMHYKRCIQDKKTECKRHRRVEVLNSENLNVEQTCIICCETFVNYDQLKVHIDQRGHEQVTTTETINKCLTCNTYFQRFADLTRHMKIMSHTGNPKIDGTRKVATKSKPPYSIFCSLCKIVFPTVEKCEEHIKKKTCSRQWRKRCPFCPHRYKKRNIFEVHVNVDHQYKFPLNCDKCGKDYMMLSAYIKHREKCNEDLSVSGKEKLKNKEVKCSFCHQLFNSRALLGAHKWKNHMERIFECDTCKMKFKRHDHLTRHMKTFNHSSSMMDLESNAHGRKCKLFYSHEYTEEKSEDGQTFYKCGACKTVFRKLSYLRRHQREKHQSEKPNSLLCEYCGYKTSLKSSLRNHVETVHNKIDSDTKLCNVCGKNISKFAFRTHMAAHKGAKKAANDEVM